MLVGTTEPGNGRIGHGQSKRETGHPSDAGATVRAYNKKPQVRGQDWDVTMRIPSAEA